MTSKSMNLPHQNLAQLLMHDIRVDAGALSILKDHSENEVEISNFQVNETGMGLGSKTIWRLTCLADCYGINLMVIPAVLANVVMG